MTDSRIKKFSRYKNGDILEIPLLPHLDMFGYAKFIHRSKENPGYNYVNPFKWIVFDYFSDSRILNIDKIDTATLLCNPLYMFWNLSLSGLDGWKVIGNSKVLQNEWEAGFVRRLNHLNHAISIEEYKNINWSVYLDTESSLEFGHNWQIFPWKQVNHLERSGSTSLNCLPFRIILEKMKKDHVNFDLTNISKMEWLIYRQCCDIPPYNEIPHEFRQIPIPLEFEVLWKDKSKLYFNYNDYMNKNIE